MQASFLGLSDWEGSAKNADPFSQDMASSLEEPLLVTTGQSTPASRFTCSFIMCEYVNAGATKVIKFTF